MKKLFILLFFLTMFTGTKAVEEPTYPCTGSYNNHSYVDLGLPSGTLWATCNIGAESPEIQGGRFAWGEYEVKDSYNSDNYSLCQKDDNAPYSGANGHFGRYSFPKLGDISNTDYDTAKKIWGNGWRMPTENEVQELQDMCSKEWIKYNDKICLKFTSGNGNFIIIGPMDSDGTELWTSTPCDSDNEEYGNPYARTFQFPHTDSEAGSFVYWYAKSHGFNIRPVMSRLYDCCVGGIFYKLDNEKQTAEVAIGPNDNNTRYSGDIAIPSHIIYNGIEYTVDKIGDNAFNGCSSLNSVSLPETVSKIGEFAFNGCEKLTDVTIPENVVEIKWRAFCGCNNIENVVIPNSTRTLGGEIWRGCSKLSSITIGSSITDVFGYQFVFCDNITSIYCYAAEPPSARWDLNGDIYNQATLLVPSSSIGKYKNSDPWKNFGKICTIEIEEITTYPTSGSYNDHSYVDLGLPSGTLWATSNIGANSPEEYGDYYAWGETETKSDYSWDNYLTCYGASIYSEHDCGTSKDPLASYQSIAGTQYDVAHVKWGGNWEMPSKEYQDELRTKCTWQWSSLNGIEGYKVTGPNGNFIFLPAAGYIVDSRHDYVGTNGFYWSSSLKTDCLHDAYYINFSSDDIIWDGGYCRYDGRSVRPVIHSGDIVVADNYLTVQNTTAFCGKQIDFAIGMENKAAISSVMFDITLPEGMTVESDEFGYFYEFNPDRIVSRKPHAFEGEPQSDGSIRFMSYSSSGLAHVGNTGDLVYLPINVSEDIEAGTYEIKLSNIKLAVSASEAYTCPDIVAKVTVNRYTLGDVNNDGGIDNQDVVGTVELALNRPTTAIREAADINNDGAIDNQDVVGVVSLALNRPLFAPTQTKLKAQAAEDPVNVLKVESIYADKNSEEATLAVSLDNQTQFTSVMLDLYLPEGVSVLEDEYGLYLDLNNSRCNGSRGGFTVDGEKQEDGAVRIMLYSSKGTMITGNSGDLFYITLKTTGDIAAGNHKFEVKRIICAKDATAAGRFEMPNDNGYIRVKGVEPISLVVPEGGYATICLPYEATLPTGLKAYKATGIKDGMVVLEEQGNIAACTPLIIQGTAGTYNFSGDNSGAEEFEYSVGSLKSSLIPAECNQGYVLQNLSKGLGFYKIKDALTVPAFRSVLEGAAVNFAPAFVPVGFDEDATAISSVETAVKNGSAIYTLDGKRVKTMEKGKIYIVGGVKMMVK